VTLYALDEIGLLIAAHRVIDSTSIASVCDSLASAGATASTSAIWRSAARTCARIPAAGWSAPSSARRCRRRARLRLESIDVLRPVNAKRMTQRFGVQAHGCVPHPACTREIAIAKQRRNHGQAFGVLVWMQQIE